MVAYQPGCLRKWYDKAVYFILTAPSLIAYITRLGLCFSLVLLHPITWVCWHNRMEKQPVEISGRSDSSTPRVIMAVAILCLIIISGLSDRSVLLYIGERKSWYAIEWCFTNKDLLLGAGLGATFRPNISSVWKIYWSLHKWFCLLRITLIGQSTSPWRTDRTNS